MNTPSIWSPGLLVLALAAVSPAQAQDPAAVGPDIYKCIFENERTRVCEVTFKAGAKMPSHSHPEHLAYVLQPGKMRLTDDPSGEGSDVDFATGQAVWMPAVTHHGENIGQTEVKVLVIEFKDRAAKPKPKDETTK